jgi:hypothetical protein
MGDREMLPRHERFRSPFRTLSYNDGSTDADGSFGEFALRANCIAMRTLASTKGLSLVRYLDTVIVCI